MIRLRNADGSTTPVDSARATEYVDEKGRLAVAITQGKNGTVTVLTPGDPVFRAYCNSFNLTPSPVTVHEPFEGVAAE